MKRKHNNGNANIDIEKSTKPTREKKVTKMTIKARNAQSNKTNALVVPASNGDVPYGVIQILNNAEVRKRLATASHDLAVKVLQSTDSMKQYERETYLSKLGAVIKNVPLSSITYTKGQLLSETVTLRIPLPEYFGQWFSFSCTIQRHFETGELKITDVRLTNARNYSPYDAPYVYMMSTMAQEAPYHVYAGPNVTGVLLYDLLQIIKTLVQYLPNQVRKYFSSRGNNTLDLRRLIATIDTKLADLGPEHKSRVSKEAIDKTNMQAKLSKVNAMTTKHANAVAKEKAKTSYPQWTRNSAAYSTAYNTSGHHPYMTRSNVRHIMNATYPTYPSSSAAYHPTHPSSSAASYHPTFPSTSTASYHPTMPMYNPLDPKFQITR